MVQDNKSIFEVQKIAGSSTAQQKDNDDYTGSSSSSSSIHTRPRVFSWSDEMLDIISRKYYGVFHEDINNTIGDYFRKLQHRGMDPNLIVEAIEQSGWAKKPTPYYMRAILNRYLDEDILTLEDLLADKAERRAEKARERYGQTKGWFY